MKCEASLIINLLNLKPDLKKRGIYTGNEFCLIVSGIGTDCVKNTFAQFPEPVDRNGDLFINIGVCGCTNETYSIGSVFLVNDIHSETNSIPYYPDMLIKSNIPEAGCTSYSGLKTDLDCPTLLADMEAYAFYNECLKHVTSDRIHLLKIVSDYMEPSQLTKNDISGIVHKAVPTIQNYISALQKYKKTESLPDYSIYYDKYKFTASIKTELNKLNMFYFYRNNLFPDSEIYNGFLKPNSKKESLRIYNDIKKQLL